MHQPGDLFPEKFAGWNWRTRQCWPKGHVGIHDKRPNPLCSSQWLQRVVNRTLSGGNPIFRQQRPLQAKIRSQLPASQTPSAADHPRWAFRTPQCPAAVAEARTHKTRCRTQLNHQPRSQLRQTTWRRPFPLPVRRATSADGANASINQISAAGLSIAVCAAGSIYYDPSAGRFIPGEVRFRRRIAALIHLGRALLQVPPYCLFRLACSEDGGDWAASRNLGAG